MEVQLVCITGSGVSRSFSLLKRRTVIGRTSRCDIRIPLLSVSRQHCEIIVNNNQVTLRDLGSTTGTSHNRNRVKTTNLQAGDIVTVGPVIFTLVVNGQPPLHQQAGRSPVIKTVVNSRKPLTLK